MHTRALHQAVRDTLRTATSALNWAALPQSQCEIMADGRPAPRCGKTFIAVHPGGQRNAARNTRQDLVDVQVTLTQRLNEPFDAAGTNLFEKAASGMMDLADQVAALLHMNYDTMNNANTNLAAFAGQLANPPTQIYGYSEPLGYESRTIPSEVGPDWFWAAPEMGRGAPLGYSLTLFFTNARCDQPLALQQ